MANEFNITTRLRLINGVLRVDFSPSPFSVDQASALVYDNVHTIGTTEESIASTVGDITTEGIAILQNLDATNFVQWGPATTVYVGRLKPSHIPAMWNMEPGASLFLKADTAACNVRVLIFEA